VILTGKLELTADDYSTVTVADAIKAYREFKQKRSDDTKRKIKLLTVRLQAFLEGRGMFNIDDVRLPDLSAFRETWTVSPTTQRRDQEILKSFFLVLLSFRFHQEEPGYTSRPDFGESAKN
jgi:hypothetical protein